MAVLSPELLVLVDHYLLEWDTRRWANAYHSLIELGPSILPELHNRLLDSPSPAFREALVELAYQLHSEDALPLFEQALRDPSAEVWKAALDGLVDLASAASIRALEAAVPRSPAGGTGPDDWKAWVLEALQQARGRSAARDGTAAPPAGTE